MNEENIETKEQLEKLIKAVDALSGEVVSMEKRMERLESKSLASGAVPVAYDAPPKPPAFYNKEKAEEIREIGVAEPVQTIEKNFTTEKESMESEIGIKWFGRIGIFALILGISFFLKYSFDRNWIPEEARVIMGILAGLALVILGEKSREKYIQYALILTGGGIAVLYLSIYAAYSYYDLISQGIAFATMGVITFASGVLAIYYNKSSLAALAVFGGFITPALLSTGVNNQLALFIYITLLNLGILGISFYRNWRGLNLLGFLGTIALFLGWRAVHYTEDQLFLTIIFLAVTFMIYAVSTISHNILAENKTEKADAVLITMNAIIFFVICYSLLDVNYTEYMGFFAVVMALVYFIFAAIAFRLNPGDKYLALFLPGLSIFFLAIAAPIQFDGNWVTIAWLLEAAIIMRAGFYLPGSRMRSFSWAIFVLAITRLIFMDIHVGDLSIYTIIFNERFLTFTVGIIVTACIYYFYSQNEKNEDLGKVETVKRSTLLLAAFLLLLILSSEVTAYFDKKIQAITRPVYPNCRSGSNYQSGSDSYSSPYCQSQYTEYNNAYKAQTTETTRIRNTQNVVLSILWALYAITLLALGFLRKNRLLRLAGMGLFGVTILKLFFVDLSYLEQLYRIISFMVLGVILMLASFGYSKYKDRIKEII